MGERNHYIYEFGPFRLDAQKRLLQRDGRPVKMFPKEFDTLLALVERSGEVLNKDELMRRVWGETVVEEGNLTSNISHLRRLLGDSRERHQYIVTIPGKGYRFVAGVRAGFDEVIVRERARAEVRVEEEVEDDAEGDRPAGWRAHVAPGAAGAPRRRGRMVLLWAAAGFVLAALGIASYLLLKPRPGADGGPAPFREVTLTRLTNSGRATLAAVSPDGKYVVYAEEDDGGQSLRLRQVATASDMRIAGPKPAEYWGLTVSPDGDYVYATVWEGKTGRVTLYKVPLFGGPPVKLPLDADSPISFSPDGARFAFVETARDVTRLRVADAGGADSREVASRRQPDYFGAIRNGPAWSPDGRVIAVPLSRTDEAGRFEVVVAVNPDNGSERQITSRRWWSVRHVKWLPDGSGLLATAREQATSPSQVWHIPYPEGPARRLTNDVTDYEGVSLTADAGALVTMQASTLSHLWVVPASDVGESSPPGGGPRYEVERASRLVSETGGIWDVAWAPGGRVCYISRASGGAELWAAGADGEGARRLTTGARADGGLAVSPDGRFIVFASARDGAHNLWRVEADGGAPVRLTSGNSDVNPHVSPDGRWVVFQRGKGLVLPTAWKVPLEGGEATPLVGAGAQRPRLSPDGKLVAYYYLDSDVGGDSRWSIGVAPFETGRRVARFDFPPMVVSRIVRWTPDGKGLAYVEDRGGVSNIWARPLDGGEPAQLTDFRSEQVLAFDWTRDGRRLAVVRGTRASDVVLVEPGRK